MDPRELSLRPFENSDTVTLQRWLNQAYIQRWYHDPEDWLQEVNQRHGAYHWLHHFIVMKENLPIGFCQYYDCYDARHLEDWYCVDRRGETYSIDYFIGEEALLGCGYGKAMVRLLTDTIWQNEGAAQIIVQPDRENEPSNRVLLASGYHFDAEKGYYFKQNTKK